MRKTVLLSLLICMSIFAARSQDNDPRLDSASDYIDAGNYGKAINIYSGILSADTKNARVYELRGYAYGQMKDYESALKDYTFSIRADEHYWLAYLRRADLLAKAEYYEEAIADYDDAFLNTDVDSTLQRVVILVNRAAAKQMYRDTIGAVADLRKSLEYDSGNIAALINLGGLLPDIGKPREAIDCLEKAIRLDSTEEGAYGNLAFLYSELGEYPKALAINNKLLTFKPGEPYALNNRGFVKYKMNDLQGALEDINNSISILPANSYAFKNRGLVYLAMKRKEEACTDFMKALGLGFEKYYGEEVSKLIKANCKKPENTMRTL